MVGNLGVGGTNPIRLQSMTTTNTTDERATAEQALRMVEAGCEIVRITTPSVQSARKLEAIRKILDRQGCRVPLVADIHFDPSAAMEAAEWADKVRINPGNFVDTKKFAVREYSDEQYAQELARIEQRFVPLVEKLKRLGRALRIGANHGSLSDRIMNRYGDTPLGMVESALEYMRICRANNFHDIIFSMKASNPKVMIAAYRLLAARLSEQPGCDYPFHLGVTEAGDGEDGRVKSAVGMGSLLEDGIGDTLRVSLTEDPEFEIPVCRILSAPFQPTAALREQPETAPSEKQTYCENLFDYRRRKTQSVRVGPFRLGGEHPVRVVTQWPQPGARSGAEILAFLEAQLKANQALEPEILEWPVSSPEDIENLKRVREHLKNETSRIAFLGRVSGDASLTAQALPLLHAAVWSDATINGNELLESAARLQLPLFIESADVEEILRREKLCRRKNLPAVLTLAPQDGVSLLHQWRRLIALSEDSDAPVHICAPREDTPETLTMRSASLIGSLLCDGIGDSVQIRSELTPTAALRLVYCVLQAAGVRITKTEYVSCPSCGRTLFNLQETTERIKAQTGHLKGVKIAIMGCIVNGPGEMADADFGYVGGAPGKINLYVGKKCVKKGIPSENADRALIDLIKSNNKWTQPASDESKKR